MRSERQGSNIRNFASKINLFIFIFGCIWVFLAASGLSLLAVSRGCSRVAVCAVASLVVGHGLCGEQTSVAAARGLCFCAALRLWSTGLVVLMKGLSCHVACGILPEHGWNLCPLHWEVDSQPLDYQGSLEFCIFKRSFWKMQREGVEELLSLFLSCSACKRTGTSCLKLSLMIFAHRGELYSFVHLINPFYSCHSSRHTAP